MLDLMRIMGLSGHQTEFLGLSMNQQELLNRARSVWEGIRLEGLYVIGADTPADVMAYFFASFDKSGEKAAALGLDVLPKVIWLGEPGQKDGPVMFTVPSASSRACAIAVVSYTETDQWSGYGVIESADAAIVGIYDDLDAAEAKLGEFAMALKTLRKAVNTLARAESKPPERKGFSF